MSKDEHDQAIKETKRNNVVFKQKKKTVQQV